MLPQPCQSVEYRALACIRIAGQRHDVPLERLGQPAAGWLDAGAVVVAKHFWRDAPPERIGGLVRARDRRFGETALSVYPF